MSERRPGGYWVVPIRLGLPTCLFFLTILLMAVNVTATAAQGLSDPQLAQVSVRLWPEYDDPRLLVLYGGAFAEDTDFPRVVEFIVPLKIEVNQAAAVNSDGALVRMPYQLVPQDGHALLRYELPGPAFFFEYYVDSIQVEDEKSIEWELRSQYPVADLYVEVQQPMAATGFRVSPAPDLVTVGEDGFRLFLFAHRALDAVQKMVLRISYTKTDPEPSVLRQTTAAPARAGSMADAIPTDGNPSPVMLLAFGGLAGLLALGAYWQVSRRQEAVAVLAERDSIEHSDESRRPVLENRGPTENCRRCGRVLFETDSFCPGCGSPVRARGESG